MVSLPTRFTPKSAPKFYDGVSLCRFTRAIFAPGYTAETLSFGDTGGAHSLSYNHRKSHFSEMIPTFSTIYNPSDNKFRRRTQTFFFLNIHFKMLFYLLILLYYRHLHYSIIYIKSL